MHGGRFFPFAGTPYFIHYFIPNLHVYRAVVLALVLLNVLQFYYLLRLWNLPRAAAQLGALSAALFLQTRVFCDPILSFAGLLQILTAELFATYICLQKYLDTRRLAWLAASLAVYTIALLTYEISFATFPLLAIMIWTHFRRWSQACAVLRPYATIVALVVVFVLGLRYHVPRDEKDAYQPSGSLSLVAATTLAQASGALPMSYPLLDIWTHQSSEPRVFGSTCGPLKEQPKQILFARRLFGRSDNWLIFLAAGALTWMFLRQTNPCETPRKAPLGLLIAGGAARWILPGAPIAFSPKYQDWVRPGYSYLPVYLQYFGVAMLFSAVLQWLATTNARQRWVCASGLIALNAVIGMVTFDTTRFVTRCFRDSAEARSRELIEHALSAGLAEEVADGATIWLPKRYRWAGASDPRGKGGLFTQRLGRKIHAVSGPANPGWLPDPATFPQIAAPTFELHDQFADDQSGFVVLSVLSGADRDANPAGLSTLSFRAYLRGSYLRAAETGSISFVAAPAGGGESAAQSAQASKISLIHVHSNEAICQGSFASPVDAASITATTDPQPEPRPMEWANPPGETNLASEERRMK